MVRLWEREIFESSLEEKILIGLIVSDTFCKFMIPKLKVEYFKSPFCKILCKWIFSYYRKFRVAPKKNINEIFDSKKEKLSREEIEIIHSFLARIDERYQTEKDFNIEYLAQITDEFIRKRSLEILNEKIDLLLRRGKEREAENLVLKYKRKSDLMTVHSLDELASMHQLFSIEESLFCLPGKLGDFMGPFERGWLVAILAPMKRGKTWWLQDLSFRALISGLKVLFISLEMPMKDIVNRWIQIASGYCTNDSEYYLFDCLKNRRSTCTLEFRKNKSSYGTKKYIPCTYCRDCEEYKEFYEPCLSRFVREKDSNFSNALKEIKRISKYFKLRRLKFECFPTYSITLSQIFNIIDHLELVEDFPPDVVVIDYADLIRPRARYESLREGIGEVWSELKRIATEKHCLVITASQSTRRSISKFLVGQEDVAEDIRKVAVVDVMIALNQSSQEREKNILRVSILAHRHRSFSSKQVVVTYNYNMGQTILDSEYFDDVKEILERDLKILYKEKGGEL